MKFNKNLYFIVTLAFMVTARKETEDETTVDCDYLSTQESKSSCYNCTSTIRCTKQGGRVTTCNQRRPYCIDGRCSDKPSEECINEETETLTQPEDVTETTSQYQAATNSNHAMVECDFSSSSHGSKVSCYNCTSTVRCTKQGGRVTSCNQKRPYCVDGRCSAEQTEECIAVDNILADDELILYKVV